MTLPNHNKTAEDHPASPTVTTQEPTNPTPDKGSLFDRMTADRSPLLRAEQVRQEPTFLGRLLKIKTHAR